MVSISILIKNILTSCLSLLLIVAVIEILLQLMPFVSHAPETISINMDQPIKRYKVHDEFVYAKGRFGDIVQKHKTNELGFNTPISFIKDKPTHCMIGDSYVEAMQVSSDDSFHGLLNQNDVSVYPIASSGSPLSQYIAYAKWAIREFNCQKLFFFIIENDFDESLISVKNAPGFHYFNEKGLLTLVEHKKSQLKDGLKNLALINYLHTNLEISRLISQNQSSDNSFDSDSLDRKVKNSIHAIDFFFEHLLRISFSLQDVVMVLDGDRHSIYNNYTDRQGYNAVVYDYFKDKLDALNIEKIDLHPIFFQHYKENNNQFNFKTDYHWNEVGHEVVSKALLTSNLM